MPIMSWEQFRARPPTPRSAVLESWQVEAVQAKNIKFDRDWHANLPSCSAAPLHSRTVRYGEYGYGVPSRRKQSFLPLSFISAVLHLPSLSGGRYGQVHQFLRIRAVCEPTAAWHRFSQMLSLLHVPRASIVIIPR
jgi:hypothetical protein